MNRSAIQCPLGLLSLGLDALAAGMAMVLRWLLARCGVRLTWAPLTSVLLVGTVAGARLPR